MASKKQPETEPVDEQCPAEEGGVRCLLVIHDDTIAHAFTEEAVQALVEDEEGIAAGGAPQATPEPEEAPEEQPMESLVPLRTSVNSWWCGKSGCDTAMPHRLDRCATCGTYRA